MMESMTDTKFSLTNLDVFRRQGVALEARDAGYKAGCRVTFPNGWAVSIQWGAGNYGSNYDAPIDRAKPVPDATTAEIAVIAPGEHGDMVRWMDDDVVQGWCTMERVQHVLDLVAEGKLMREYQAPPPPPEMRADDGWDAPASAETHPLQEDE
jgi:hypothetical protein